MSAKYESFRIHLSLQNKLAMLEFSPKGKYDFPSLVHIPLLEFCHGKATELLYDTKYVNDQLPSPST